MYDLKGKVAFITGAGSEHGMGRAIANRLAQEGADVVVNDISKNPYADYTPEWGGASQVAKEVEALGRRGLAVLGDITDSAQVDTMVRQATDTLGHIDILINAAALRQGPDLAPVVELDEKVWDQTQAVNVKGTFLCSRAVARGMISRGQGGKIVIISSIAGKQGYADHAAYCTSKFALIGFTQSLAQELAKYQINVNAICPASVQTDRTDSIADALSPEAREKYLTGRAERVPIGRVAEGADIAKTVTFLCSPESDYLTGLSISVAGGYMMH